MTSVGINFAIFVNHIHHLWKQFNFRTGATWKVFIKLPWKPRCSCHWFSFPLVHIAWMYSRMTAYTFGDSCRNRVNASSVTSESFLQNCIILSICDTLERQALKPGTGSKHLPRNKLEGLHSNTIQRYYVWVRFSYGWFLFLLLVVALLLLFFALACCWRDLKHYYFCLLFTKEIHIDGFIAINEDIRYYYIRITNWNLIWVLKSIVIQQFERKIPKYHAVILTDYIEGDIK